MAIIHVQPIQIKCTFVEKSLAFSGKTTAMNLSTDINSRLSIETVRETSGRK